MKSPSMALQVIATLSLMVILLITSLVAAVHLKSSKNGLFNKQTMTVLVIWINWTGMWWAATKTVWSNPKIVDLFLLLTRH